MVGSHEADDNRLTGRVARAPRPRPTEHLPVVESGPIDDSETEGGDALVADPAVAPAEPEIEAVTKLMGFLRNSED